MPDQATAGATKPDLLDQIDQLDVELSLMVAEDASTWSTSELRTRGEQLLNQAETTLERGRARVLLNRIEEFHSLEKRYQAIALSAAPGDLKSPAEGKEPGRLAVDDDVESMRRELRDRLNQPSAPNASPNFDGTGYLMPVHARRSDVPPFALVDKTGRIVQYVSPAPGLNLHRYRKLQVGVFGQRGFIPTLETPHVTAQRVIVIDPKR